MRNLLIAVLLAALSTTAWADGSGALNIVETARAAGNFNTLLAAVDAAGLTDALSGEDHLTVFAPTDDAFAALPEGTVAALLEDIPQLTAILTYHVVPGANKAEAVVGATWHETLQGQALKVSVGESVMIDDATVLATDVMASNGVIHVIDKVILPRANIVETATEAGSFGTLLAAATAAGLVDTLSNGGPFTVFAPTDDAFGALPEGTVEALLNDIPSLKKILTYHVVPGRVLSTDITGDLESLNGTLAVGRTAAGVTIAGSNVVAADIIAANGVIHVIDKVMIPAAAE